MSIQREIITCLQVQDEGRDQNWQEHFFNLLPQACLTLLSDQSQQGSDGMPYFLIQIKEDSKEPAGKLLNWLAQKGIGLVVHPEKKYPDYIFPYGMIWHFKETHQFIHSQSSSKLNFSEPILQNPTNSKAILAHPSDAFLPLYVRSILKQFFFDQGIYQPRFLMIGQDQQNMDICFSVESLGNPPVSEHEGILKAISWFVPQHYSLAISQKSTHLPFISL